MNISSSFPVKVHKYATPRALCLVLNLQDNKKKISRLAKLHAELQVHTKERASTKMRLRMGITYTELENEENSENSPKRVYIDVIKGLL